MIKEAIQNFKRIRKHRKEVTKICEEKFMALYNHPLYNDDLLAIKEEMKKDINIYKSIQLFHDLSCYNPKEFIPTMNWYYGKYGKAAIGLAPGNKGYEKHMKCMSKFLDAKSHHLTTNRHHYESSYIMNRKDVLEMIVDWEAEYGNAQKYYLERYSDILLDEKTKICIEEELGLRKFRGPFKYDIYNKDLSKIKHKYNKKQFNLLLSYVNKRYNLDLYSILP